MSTATQPTSSQPVLTADQTIAWLERTSTNWRKFLADYPAVLTLPCDIYKTTQTVADFLLHIVAAELRYAQRLADLPESAYDSLPHDNIDAIYATHDRALALLRTLLADPAYDWSAELTFNTLTLGRLAAPRSAILFHLLLHGQRHYSQLATLVRRHGHKTTFPMDYLIMEARRA